MSETGVLCQRCREPIDPRQAATYPDCLPYLHVECAVRMSVGSEAHQRRLCSCYGMAEDCGDPDGESPRDAARRAFVYFRSRQPPDFPREAGYRCPRCGMVSHNPNDLIHRYCGNCHRFEDDPEGLPDAKKPNDGPVPQAEA